MSFGVSDIPDLAGRSFVVTGANSGIGFEAARMLGARGARVVLACRDEARMAEAAEKLRAAGANDVACVPLDLADLASVRDASRRIRALCPRLDVLVNNAGVMALPERETKDGFEMQLGTNHLGHFALTAHLFPSLCAAKAPRVVHVSSELHRRGALELEDLPKPRAYDPWAAYQRSKLANVLFGYELDRRAKAAGLPLLSVVCHPGYAATNLQSGGARAGGSALQAWVMSIGNVLFAQSAAMGAMPTVMAAVADGLAGGEYIGPGGFKAMRGAPAVGRSNARSHDPELARALWEASERLTGVRFAVGREAEVALAG